MQKTRTIIAALGLATLAGGAWFYHSADAKEAPSFRTATVARGSDVLTQFLVESILMCLLGGLLGLFMGSGGAALPGRLTGWHTSTPASAIALALGFSASVGVFFGFSPARKAAGLDPIQALRYE